MPKWKQELLKLVCANGYKVAVDNVMWKKKEFRCDWYYEFDSVFELKRDSDGHRLLIIPVGDMLVFNPDKPEEDFFEWKNDHARGKLTETLIKNGHWEMNNWFEVIDLEKQKGIYHHINSEDDTISYGVEDAFEMIKEYLKPRVWSVS